MATATGGGWDDALADVERSIADCLSALDRYEAAFQKVLGDHGTPTADVPVPAAGADWDVKLAAARGTADDVEKLLAEQEAVWGRWRAALGQWAEAAAARPA